jgi:hypothetical protein
MGGGVVAALDPLVAHAELEFRNSGRGLKGINEKASTVVSNSGIFAQ